MLWKYGKKSGNPYHRGRISATVYPAKDTDKWTYLLYSTELIYSDNTYPSMDEAMIAVEKDIDHRLAMAPPTEQDMVDLSLEWQIDVDRDR